MIWCLTTVWTTENSRFLEEKGIVFLLSGAFRLSLGPTQPPVQKITGAHSVSINLPAKIKSAWSSNSTPRMCYGVEFKVQGIFACSVPITSEYNATFQELEINFISNALGSVQKNRKTDRVQNLSNAVL